MTKSNETDKMLLHAFTAGLVIGSILGGSIVAVMSRISWTHAAISRGVAIYDSKSGQFKWINEIKDDQIQ